MRPRDTQAPWRRRYSPAAPHAQCVAAFILALLACLPGLALAQPVGSRLLVTGGEHGPFTRIVLQSNRPLIWSLAGADRLYHLSLEPSRQEIDLARAFDRIGRERLARIERDDAGLVLHLACDCGIDAFEDRPGVIVLDIRPRAETDDRTPPAPATAPVAQHDLGTVTPPEDTALRSGRAVADRLRRARYDTVTGRDLDTDPADTLSRVPMDFRGGPVPPAPLPTQPPAPAAGQGTEPLREDADALARRMASRLVEAAEQGLLTHAAGEGRGDRLRPALRLAPPPEAASQLRITSDLSPEDRTDPLADRPLCRQGEALEFLSLHEETPFVSRHAALMRSLHGEFDRQDISATDDMVKVYLRHGFGAEARQLIDTAGTRLNGHDLLLGLADLLENRQSNARRHLSGLVGCPGPAGLIGALSTMDVEALLPHADRIALTFAELPAPLQRILGEPLVARLLESGAVDQARIVAHAMQHVGPAGTTHPALPSALIGAARGDRDDAAALLASRDGDGDARRLLLRLRLALEGDGAIEPATLQEAEDVAGIVRREHDGALLMSKAIRLRARDGQFAAGFAAVDRLRTWLGNSREDRLMDRQLTDLMWRELAGSADDQMFLAHFMTRRDRAADSLSDETRTALADRLLRLGLARPALDLVTPPGDAAHVLARAEALVLLGQPAEALASLADLAEQPADAQAARLNDTRIAALRARSLQALGATDAAITALAEDGRMRDAMRLALTGGDWGRVERLLTHPADAPEPVHAPTEPDDRRAGAVVPAAPSAAAATPGGASAAEALPTNPIPPAPASPPAPDRQPAPADTETVDDQDETVALMALARAFGRAPGLALPDARPAPAAATEGERATIEASPPPARIDTALSGADAVRRNTALLEESASLRAMVQDLLGPDDGRSP